MSRAESALALLFTALAFASPSHFGSRSGLTRMCKALPMPSVVLTASSARFADTPKQWTEDDVDIKVDCCGMCGSCVSLAILSHDSERRS